MYILRKLTLASLKENKRRTIVTILGTMLSCALMLATVGLITSVQKMMANFMVEEYGAYHEMFQDVPAGKIGIITQNQQVSSYYFGKLIAKTEENAEQLAQYDAYLQRPYAAKYVEKISADAINAPSASGTSNTGTVPSTSGTQNASNTTAAPEALNVFVTYANPVDYATARADILSSLNKETASSINYRTNKDYLMYNDFVADDGTLKTLYQFAGIVVAIIIVTSIFTIRNAFSISASERQRQFGMLASIGATPRQIRHSVIFEGIVIAACGIPFGIVLGTIAVAVLVWLMNVLIGDMLESAAVISLPWWIFPIATLLSFVTIFLSSLWPAIRAGRMAPIVAIRGNNDINMRPNLFARIFKIQNHEAKKLKTSKLTKRIFGIGGVIAQKNLQRSRKKYRTTVVSLVVSIAVFVGLFSFMDYGFKMSGLRYNNEKIELETYGENSPVMQNLLAEAKTKFDLPKSTSYISHHVIHETRVFAMDEKSFAEFAKTNGVPEKDLSNVVLFDDRTAEFGEAMTIQRTTNLRDGENYKIKIQPDYPSKCETQVEREYEGQTFVMTDLDQACVEKSGFAAREVEFKITKIIDQSPLGQNDISPYPRIYVSENYAKIADLKFSENSYREFYVADLGDEAKLKDLENFVKNYIEGQGLKDKVWYQNILELSRQQFRMSLVIAIFLYGFVAVITLIGVTNIFNTITTNVALRAKEFAMLKSVGMTTREFNRMVRLESLMYSLKSLLIGLPLGLGLSWGFYKAVAGSVDFGYNLPWPALAISILAVGLLVSVIMRYSVKQVEKQNIIETIRSDNI